MDKQNVLVSIDVEAPIGEDGINKLVYGKIGNEEYGINRIMDILDSYGIKGLFFVDIAEAWEYGFDIISQVMKDIDKRGHDVGVHLHPDRMSDKDRKFLWQYSYDEQLEMISKCTDFYKNTLNRNPISFRAGRYGANNDTLNILNSLGYKIDMSMYYGMWKRCRIEGDYSTINRIKVIQELTEVPVTVFKSFDLLGYKRYDKIDESMPYGEFRLVVNKVLKENSVDVISFFMHSFSLLNWRKDPDNPSANKQSEKRIKKMVEYLSVKSIDFINEQEALDLCCFVESEQILVDTSRSISSIIFSLKRAIKIMHEKKVRNI